MLTHWMQQCMCNWNLTCFTWRFKFHHSFTVDICFSVFSLKKSVISVRSISPKKIMLLYCKHASEFFFFTREEGKVKMLLVVRLPMKNPRETGKQISTTYEYIYQRSDPICHWKLCYCGILMLDDVENFVISFLLPSRMIL